MVGPPLKKTRQEREERGTQQTVSSQYARWNDEGDMPPPPPTRKGRAQDMVEESQMTQMHTGDTTVDTRSVGNGGMERRGGGAPSLQDSSVPAGFFQDIEEQATGQHKKEQDASRAKEGMGEFNAFMQEISALGAVKNIQDGTIMEVSEEPPQVRDVEDSVHLHSQEDIDGFEQFVREERMKEIKEAVRQRNAAVFEENGHSVLAQVSGVATDNVVTIPAISLPPQERSIAESYNRMVHEEDIEQGTSSDEDDDDDGWRHKKLQ